MIVGAVLLSVIDWLQDQPGLRLQTMLRGAAALLFLTLGISASERLYGASTLLLAS